MPHQHHDRQIIQPLVSAFRKTTSLGRQADQGSSSKKWKKSPQKSAQKRAQEKNEKSAQKRAQEKK